jgi:nucleoside-diphosphate-sugar epimerase
MATGGPAVDLRDDRNVRSVLFDMLFDWNGSDLKKVYEPITDQISYFFLAFLIIIGIGIAIGSYKKYHRKRKERTIPYKVIKPPVYLTEEPDPNKSTVVAVVGATGFVGSHIAEMLISSGKYRVYLLGRSFRDLKLFENADAVFQVDMMDYDGLVNAFQSVNLVINAAAVVPTVFTSDDDLWRLNVVGPKNIIAAVKDAGVDHFIQISGVDIENDTNLPAFQVFANALYDVEKYIQDDDNLKSCIMKFGQIYGVRSKMWDAILSGEITQLPKAKLYATFAPVEYVATAVVKAVCKMTENNDDRVVGKVIKIGGYPTTFAEFLSVPEWGREIKDCPVWVINSMARVNVIIGRITGWAPFGADLCPAITSFFDAFEEKVDNSIAYEVLGIDEVPDINDGVGKMVQRWKENNS